MLTKEDVSSHDSELSNSYKIIIRPSEDDLILDRQTYDKEILQKEISKDAYSKIIDILKMAKEECIIIDNYADKSVLDMISNINVNVILITKEKGLLKELDIKKYNEQYHNLKVISSNDFHDRFIIIDNKILYHCGASFKDLGKKCFAINKIADKEILYSILNIL